MNIIRDDDLGGLMMIPLLTQWGIRRCNVKDCKDSPTTIITGIEQCPMFGLCENHYKECKESGELKYTLEFT